MARRFLLLNIPNDAGFTCVQFHPGADAEISGHAPLKQDVNHKGICPAALGTKDEQPAAYSPDTGLFYVPTNHVLVREYWWESLGNAAPFRELRLRYPVADFSDLLSFPNISGKIL
jgi:hypothetical protein